MPLVIVRGVEVLVIVSHVGSLWLVIVVDEALHFALGTVVNLRDSTVGRLVHLLMPLELIVATLSCTIQLWFSIVFEIEVILDLC